MPSRAPVRCLLTLLTCLGAATLAVPLSATARAKVFWGFWGPVSPTQVLVPAPVVVAPPPAVVSPAPVVITPAPAVVSPALVIRVPLPRRHHAYRWHPW
jgi:hypothetical protein